MVYNQTLLQNMTDPSKLFTAANTMSGGLFGLGVILLITVAILVSMIKNPEYTMSESFMVSGFVGSIVGGLLWLIQILSWELAVIPVSILLAGLLIRFFE